MVKRGEWIKELNSCEAKNVGNSLWETEIPTSEQLKKSCRFWIDSKGYYKNKDASIEVHYSCYSPSEKFVKLHAFFFDLATYLNKEKSGAEPTSYVQEDIVLESPTFKGLKLILELEIG